jgi:sialate O-acetylesterase
VTMDIGNPADIHPSNKQDVGKRLALWALAKNYAMKDVVYSGPLAVAVTPEDGGLRVKFEHGTGLAGRGGPVTNLEIAGADGKFVPATGEVAGESLVVRAAGVAAPVAVRYGWCDACAPNLVNGAGLPASPFELRLTR